MHDLEYILESQVQRRHRAFNEGTYDPSVCHLRFNDVHPFDPQFSGSGMSGPNPLCGPRRDDLLAPPRATLWNQGTGASIAPYTPPAFLATPATQWLPEAKFEVIQPIVAPTRDTLLQQRSPLGNSNPLYDKYDSNQYSTSYTVLPGLKRQNDDMPSFNPITPTPLTKELIISQLDARPVTGSSTYRTPHTPLVPRNDDATEYSSLYKPFILPTEPTPVKPWTPQYEPLRLDSTPHSFKVFEPTEPKHPVMRLDYGNQRLNECEHLQYGPEHTDAYRNSPRERVSAREVLAETLGVTRRPLFKTDPFEWLDAEEVQLQKMKKRNRGEFP